MIFPNVPNLPGVPPVPRSPSFPPTPPPTLDDQPSASTWQAAPVGAVWGVFDSDNNQVITPDSVLDFDYRKERRVSNFPVAANSFASYNKVVLPFENVVRMSKGGSQADRTEFLNQIEAIADDTNLYSIVTPEKTYLNCNITRNELARKGAAGANFLEVDIFFIQIRQVTQQYTSTASNTANAQQPSATPAINQGKAQTMTVSQATIFGLNNPTNAVSWQLMTQAVISGINNPVQ